MNYTDDGTFDIPTNFDPCRDSTRYSPDFYRDSVPPVNSEGIDDLFN